MPRSPSWQMFASVFAVIFLTMSLGAGYERTLWWFAWLAGIFLSSIAFISFRERCQSNSGWYQLFDAVGTILMWIAGLILLFGVLFSLKTIATPIMHAFVGRPSYDSELPDNWRM